MRGTQISTDRQIAALRPAGKAYEIGIAKSRGLCLRVFPTGAKNFEFRYVAANGARRRLALGGYPDLSLSEARSKVAALRVSVVDGADPAAARLAARERARIGETLNELAEAYWRAAAVGLHGGRRRPKRASTIEGERQTWKNHVRSGLGKRAFTEIKRADIKAFMRALVTEGGLAAASVASIGGLLHAVFAFAVLEERLDGNPVAGLARPLALTSRERMFDDEALTTLWGAAEAACRPRHAGEKTAGVHARLDPVMGLAIRLLMLTLTRRNEIAGARKVEFDRKAGLWTIPSERAKAKHLHVVPLGPDALEVVDMAWALAPDSPFLFPSPRTPGQPLDAHAITRAFARTCVRKKLATGSPHDIRRSGATTLTGRYGVSRFIISLILGHTPQGGAAVTSVYDRHTYVPEKREALQQWADHLLRGGEREKTMAVQPDAKIRADADAFVEDAKDRALALCDAGELQQAVLSLCMDLSGRPGIATTHLTVLGQAGLGLAISGSAERVREWIEGFR